MQPIPKDILTDFDKVMKQRRVPAFLKSDYRKWLRYFLDFRSRYPLPESRAEQERSFSEKLRSKNQTATQRKQAADSVSIFFSLEHSGRTFDSSSSAQPCEMEHMHDRTQPVSSAALRNERAMICEPPGSPLLSGPYRRGGKQYDEWRCLRKTESPDWDDVISKLSDEIKTRHYSRKTLKHYADWSRKFQSYLKNKRPEALSSRTIQRLLGHSDVRTTMVYTHCLPSRPEKELKSPLDF